MKGNPVLVDTAEPMEMQLALLELGVPIKVVNLPIADYVISGETCLERKEGSDLSGSIKNSRIFQQINNMQEYKNKVLIYEHSDPVKGFRLQDESVLGTMAHAIVNGGLTVVHTKDMDDTAYLIKALWEKEGRGLKSVPEIKTKKPKKLIDQQNYFLSSLPEMGNKTASDLLKKFITPDKVLDAIRNVEFKVGPRSGKITGILGDIGTIKGIGVKLITMWKRVLDESDKKK